MNINVYYWDRIWNISFHFQQDRIVSMTLDKEYDVAVQAIKLLTLVLQWVTFPPLKWKIVTVMLWFPNIKLMNTNLQSFSLKESVDNV